MPSKVIPPPIENFAELLQPHLNGGKLSSYEGEYFTAPGDNYGSTISKVKAEIETPNGQTTDLHLIVKLLPENEFFLQIFQPERTFRTEQNCYTIVSPEFIRLQKEAGIADDELTNVFAQCYGSRISLDKQSTKVDYGAILVLENVSISGYMMGDRVEGFNYETALIVLRDLARFHAMGIAYRNKYPEEFNKIFKPFLKPFSLDASAPEEVRTKLIKDNLSILKNLSGMSDELFEKILLAFSVYDEYVSKRTECPDSLFSTIVHNDFWTNNIMIRYDSSRKPQNMKIVDFQVALYESLAHDVLFFLFLSVQLDIVKTKFDDLLKEYYLQFVNWLDCLGCDISEYSYGKFYTEIERVAIIQFQHIVTMKKILSMKREDIPNTEDMDVSILVTKEYLSDGFYEQLKDIILLFDENNYLNKK